MRYKLIIVVLIGVISLLVLNCFNNGITESFDFISTIKERINFINSSLDNLK